MSDSEDQGSSSGTPSIAPTAGEDGGSVVEQVKARHRKELKELQARLQSIKKAVPKGDKKRKKEAQDQMDQLEAEIKARHEQELKDAERKTLNDGTDATARACSLPSAPPSLAAADDGAADDAGAADDGRATKQTRAAKRREKKQTQEQEKERLNKETLASAGPSARDVERTLLLKQLGELGLGTKQIQSDGHCLYNAVADQLRLGLKPLPDGTLADYTKLRRIAAQFLRAHLDDFLPFLVSDTGLVFSEPEFEKYCQDVEATAAWGGQAEIQALSRALKVPIEVYQANSPVVHVGGEFPGDPLRISYHRHEYGLGEHFNSVVPLK